MNITRSLRILNSNEIKKINGMIKEQFGCEIPKSDYAFLQNTKEKIYIVSRDVERIGFEKLRIDSMGLYLGTIQPDGFRPSVEGAQIIGKIASKNVVELTQQQKHDWLQGKDLDVEEDNRIVLVKHKEDFLGSGKIKNNVLINSVPKSRRLHVVNEEIIEENEIEN